MGFVRFEWFFACACLFDRVGEEIQGMKGKQVFVLEINSTERQSWQGNVEWVQGKKKKSFRSVMELLRLIDSVVCDEAPPALDEEIELINE